MLLVTADEIPGLLPMAEAIQTMREAFVSISNGDLEVADRQALKLDGGTALVMGAARSGVGTAGKLMSVIPGNRDRGLPGTVGMLLLMDGETGEPLALMDATALTARRTAAANGCAIDLLARSDALTGLLVGCGTQATEQLLMMDTVRGLREIRVMGADPGESGSFADRMQERVGASLRAVSDPAAALEGVDLVISATTSIEPVIPGSAVPDGCHVSGIGSFRPDMREFDRALLERAGIYVESRATALEEAGELIDARAAGITAPEQWTEVGEVLAGRSPGRVEPGQVTFFKSVGHAAYDLFAARAVFEAARARGAGREWKP